MAALGGTPKSNVVIRSFLLTRTRPWAKCDIVLENRLETPGLGKVSAPRDRLGDGSNFLHKSSSCAFTFCLASASTFRCNSSSDKQFNGELLFINFLSSTSTTVGFPLVLPAAVGLQFDA